MNEITAPVPPGPTWLFVPGDRPDRFDKAARSGADAVVLDLEDSVRPENREPALDAVQSWLATAGRAWVRLSASTDEERNPDELERLSTAGGLAGVIVPKCETPEHVARVGAVLDVPVLGLIETASGVLAVERLARERALVGFAFGALDFIQDTGITDSEAHRSIRTRIALTSRSYGLHPPIDGVTTTFSDGARVLRDSREAKALGYGGKLCIHPRQLEFVRRGFAPTESELREARRILASGSSGAFSLEGTMVDAPVIARARQIVKSATDANGAAVEKDPAADPALLDSVARAFGGVPRGWDWLCARDPEFVSAFTEFVAPAEDSRILPREVRALLNLAIACSTTTLDASAAHRYVARALEAGARERDVLEVIELVSILGIHSLTSGLAILDELRPQCDEVSAGGARRTRGYWAVFERHFPNFDRSFERRLPSAHAGYRALNNILWREDGLEPRWRELVFVVVDLATTHLFTQGAALHIENALHYGASEAEIAEALALTLGLGGRSIDVGVPELVDVLAGNDCSPSAPQSRK